MRWTTGPRNTLCKCYSHFCSKNVNAFENTLAISDNEFVINELVKLTMLWTSGPRNTPWTYQPYNRCGCININKLTSLLILIHSHLHMSHNVRKRTFGHVRPAKIQISLRICKAWSESSVDAFWIAADVMCLHADSGDSDDWLESSLGAQVRRYVFSCCALYNGSNRVGIPECIKRSLQNKKNIQIHSSVLW